MASLKSHRGIQLLTQSQLLGPWFVLQNRVPAQMLTEYPSQLLGPLSELYGRSRVLQLANMWYLGSSLRFSRGSDVHDV